MLIIKYSQIIFYNNQDLHKPDWSLYIKLQKALFGHFREG